MIGTFSLLCYGLKEALSVLFYDCGGQSDICPCGVWKLDLLRRVRYGCRYYFLKCFILVGKFMEKVDGG